MKIILSQVKWVSCIRRLKKLHVECIDGGQVSLQFTSRIFDIEPRIPSDEDNVYTTLATLMLVYPSPSLLIVIDECTVSIWMTNPK